jgi:hypothetical protein
MPEIRSPHPLKLKAVLVSDDDGKTWKVVSQFYVCWQPEGTFSGRNYTGWIFKAQEPPCAPKN